MSTEDQSGLHFVAGYSDIFEALSTVPLLVANASGTLQYRIVQSQDFEGGGFFKKGDKRVRNDSFAKAVGKNFAPVDAFVCASRGSCTVKASVDLTGESAEFFIEVALADAALVKNVTKPVAPLVENEISGQKVAVLVTSKKGTAITYGSIRFAIHDPKNTQSRIGYDEGSIGPGASVLVDLNENGAAETTVFIEAGSPGEFFVRASWDDPSATTDLFADVPFKVIASKP